MEQEPDRSGDQEPHQPGGKEPEQHKDDRLAAACPPSLLEVQQARAPDEFLVESISSFETVERGFTEVGQALLLERPHTGLSRQLSTFLSDSSLALSAHNSLEEMLGLVAEQARELLVAECCVATVTLEGHPRTGEAVSRPERDRQWTTFVRWLDLFGIYELVRVNGGSISMTGEQLARVPAFRIAGIDRPLRGWLAASLTALDGSGLGAIQVFDKHDARFTAEDERALVYLAKVTSAAVERGLRSWPDLIPTRTSGTNRDTT